MHFFGCPNYSNSTKKRLDWPLNRHWFWVFPLFFFTLIVLQLMSYKIFKAKLLKQYFIIFATICLMNSPYPMLQIRASQQSITANLWTLTGHIYDEMIILIGCFSSESFFIIIFRSSCIQSSLKQVLLEILQYSQENIHVGVSFNKVADLTAWSFISTSSQTSFFPNSFSYGTPPEAAFVSLK